MSLTVSQTRATEKRDDGYVLLCQAMSAEHTAAARAPVCTLQVVGRAGFLGSLRLVLRKQTPLNKIMTGAP
jgi:hypothetical protein